MKRNAIVKIETKENSQQETVEIEIKNSKINYLEKNKTTVFLDLEKQVLIRENIELYIELLFREEKANLYIKNLQKNITIGLKLKKIDISKNKIVIQYELENELYSYQLEMEG